MGQYAVGGGTRYRKLKDIEVQMQQQQPMNLVTPVAQGLKRAKSELDLKKRENARKCFEWSIGH